MRIVDPHAQHHARPASPVTLTNRVRQAMDRQHECPVCGHRMGLVDLARQAGLRRQVIDRFLGGGTPSAHTLDRCVAFLERLESISVRRLA